MKSSKCTSLLKNQVRSASSYFVQCVCVVFVSDFSRPPSLHTHCYCLETRANHVTCGMLFPVVRLGTRYTDEHHRVTSSRATHKAKLNQFYATESFREYPLKLFSPWNWLFLSFRYVRRHLGRRSSNYGRYVSSKKWTSPKPIWHFWFILWLRSIFVQVFTLHSTRSDSSSDKYLQLFVTVFWRLTGESKVQKLHWDNSRSQGTNQSICQPNALDSVHFPCDR